MNIECEKEKMIFRNEKDGRYRILSINWEAKEEIDLIIERLGNNE